MIKRNTAVELFLYVLSLIIITVWLIEIDGFDLLYNNTRAHEDWELDEWLMLVPGILIVCLIYAVRRTIELKDEIALRKKSEALVRQQMQLKKDFMAIVSHEMRTPLNGVIGMLEAWKTVPEEEQVEMVMLAQLAAQGLSRQLDDIISFARIDQDKIETALEPFDPRAPFHNAFRIIQPEAEDKGISLQLQLDDALPSKIVSHAGPVHQIVMNLAHNALKFTAKGNISLGCRLVESDQHSIEITIQDTGTGISQEHMHTIFIPYSQIDHGKNRKYQGIGLGLSLVKRLVELLNGEIKVESTPGEGSTFTVVLPIQLSE